MRSMMRKGMCAVFIALFLCVTLVTPSFAEGIHWYNWYDASEDGPRKCSLDNKRPLTSEEFKKKVSEAVAQGHFVYLDHLFICMNEKNFSLRERDLLMAYALRNSYEARVSIKFHETLLEAAQQLESQYFGIPGGL